jgi:T-complex protein 1 subunit eta
MTALPVVILQEGTDVSQGKPQLLSNIGAIEAVVEVLKSTLGPRGMDKLIWEGSRSVTISNDGATIIDQLDIVHPAAKTLVDIAKAQDKEVGDGTTSVCIFAGEILKSVKPYVEEGIHPQVIIKGFQSALKMCLEKLRQLSVEVEKKDEGKFREMLMRCAATALNSKLISGQKKFFAQMAVDSVLHLEDDLDLSNIGIKKIGGGSVTDSFLVEGVAFKKTFSYAGFEQQPKVLKKPKIALLNVELELKSERSSAEVRVKDVVAYQQIVDAEWTIIYDKLDKLIKSGATIILSRLAIGDLATQYFADRGVFCAGRVESQDMDRVAKATGGIVQTSLQEFTASVLGACDSFEERQFGNERYNLFTGCPKAKTATIILRGGASQFLEESERSLNDALNIVKRCKQHSSVVAGGGAIEMELSKFLREKAKEIKNKTQLIVSAFARSLEVIPRQLAHNAGLDSTDIVNELRARHAKPSGGQWFGVDIEGEGVCDTFKSFVWEPTLVKSNALSAATEAACIILSVDDTIRIGDGGGEEGKRDEKNKDPVPEEPEPKKVRQGARDKYKKRRPSPPIKGKLSRSVKLPNPNPRARGPRK